MQIVYLTDIHDHFDEVIEVVKNEKADLFVISGDLAYRAFDDDTDLFRFIELQEKYKRIHAESKGEIQFITWLAARPRDDEFAEYSHLSRKADEYLGKKYSDFSTALSNATQTEIIMIPGNYDLNLAATALSIFNRHEQTVITGDIRFACYGSAPIFTAGIPEERAIDFFEKAIPGKRSVKSFLMNAKPDVVVLHNPAYGTLDKLPRFGHCGSQGAREAIDELEPALVLSGHIHENYGLLKRGSTYFLNPSNFGSVENIDGVSPGGLYAVINLQKDSHGLHLRQVDWKQYTPEKTYYLCTVHIDRKLRASEMISSKHEFEAFGRFLL